MDDNDRSSVGESEEAMDVSSNVSENIEDSGQGNPATLGNQAMPSVGPYAFENPGLPSGMSAGTSSRSSVPSSAQDLNIDQPDEAKSSSSADVSTGASGVREQSEEPYFPDTVPGEQSSSGVTSRDGAIRSDTSDRISEHPFNAVRVLYPALKKTLLCGEKNKICERYCPGIKSFFESPSSQKRKALYDELRSLLERRQNTLKKGGRKPIDDFEKMQYFTCEAFEILLHIFLQSLISTLSVRSNLKVPSISLSYRNCKKLHSRFLVCWGKVDDEKSLSAERREIIRVYKSPLESCLLSTENALEEVLSHFNHVGSNSSPGVAATRDAGSNNSGGQISKYASSAQKLLFTILKEMDEDLFPPNCSSGLIFFESDKSFIQVIGPHFRRRQNAFQERFPSRQMTSEYLTAEAYETLVFIVIQSLVSTKSVRSSLKFEPLMLNYRNLKKFYERFSEYCRESYPQDEDSRNVVKDTGKFLLQTRNAFREFLLHIGEGDVGQAIMDRYEEILFPEDKFFLRRRIL